jgi:hypothetical protein
MEYPVKYKMKILYNDDSAIIDFLADLENRTPITVLQDGLKSDKNIRGCIVNNHRKEGLVTVLLVNDPFGFNEGDNILMLFVDAKLTPILLYFQRWIETVDQSDEQKWLALYQIINILESDIKKSQTLIKE